jgi:LmbE family N-acetylglucosaminyl deacetylase
VNRTALVVAAHPDDEVLGCGGYMARMADEGWDVHVLILAEGATSRLPTRDRTTAGAELSALYDSAQRAGEILGTRSVQLAAFADNRMDGVELLDVVKRIELDVERLRPQRVLTHHLGDLNIDHAVIHQAVATACRPLPGSSVMELLFFEVASSTEWRTAHSSRVFEPSHFVDISATLSRKLDALRAYQSEIRPFPHPRSIEAVEHLARWRGATVGRMAAEAFSVGRHIE